MRLRPDFICVGAQKAGTRWIYDQCDAHPKAWMPPIKELQFFNRHFQFLRRLAIKKLSHIEEKNLDRPRDKSFLKKVIELPEKPDIAAYKGLFDPAGRRVTGDICPSYHMLDDETVRYVVRELPTCKFFYVVRDPVDRLWSQLNMNIRKGKISELALKDAASFKTVVREERLGRYSFQSEAIQQWSDAAGDRFRLYVFDDLVADPDAYRNDVFKFIGLDPALSPIEADHNRKAGDRKAPLPSEIRQILKDYLGDEYDKLRRLLGDRVSWGI